MITIEINDCHWPLEGALLYELKNKFCKIPDGFDSPKSCPSNLASKANALV